MPVAYMRSQVVGTPLDFIWLELTNQCNLQCGHCYSSSSPTSVEHDTLNTHDFERVIDEASLLGCRAVQFIGGEPTLNRSLEHLIGYAREKDFDLIEVFSNLTRVTDSLIDALRSNRATVATSVYASMAGVHEAVTQVPGSFARTTGNIRRLLTAGIPVRASVIVMDENKDHADETVAFLKFMGVDSIGVDQLRKFGRGAEGSSPEMHDLCGQCASGRLCIGPDGAVSPCIMSKAWSVGSVLDTPLHAIVASERLADVQTRIAAAVGERVVAACNPDRPNPCGPDRGGTGCNPNTHCGPNSCQPVR